MIIFELECKLGHRFEGWFPSSKNFEEQLHAGMIQCAVCGIGDIRNIPSGGHVSLARGNKPKIKSNKPKPQNKETMVNIDPVTLVKMVDHYVKSNFKNVGDQFAKKALEIHRGLSEKEPIYGTATGDEQKILAEEEVPFVTLPKLPESTEN